jgi:hypothetical protein
MGCRCLLIIGVLVNVDAKTAVGHGTRSTGTMNHMKSIANVKDKACCTRVDSSKEKNARLDPLAASQNLSGSCKKMRSCT